MSVTQYIGARYVPVFADPAEWDSERSYEPLTIVTHEGNSYTSAQSVPVGIDISNDQFWKLTGNYNAQVEQYRKEVSQFDARITTADTTANNALTLAQANAQSIANHDGRITTADTTANNALTLAQTNEGDIATLDAQMAGTATSGLKTSLNSHIYDTFFAVTVDSSLEEDDETALKFKSVDTALDYLQANNKSNVKLSLADGTYTLTRTITNSQFHLYATGSDVTLNATFSAYNSYLHFEGKADANLKLNFSVHFDVGALYMNYCEGTCSLNLSWAPLSVQNSNLTFTTRNSVSSDYYIVKSNVVFDGAMSLWLCDFFINGSTITYKSGQLIIANIFYYSSTINLEGSGTVRANGEIRFQTCTFTGSCNRAIWTAVNSTVGLTVGNIKLDNVTLTHSLFQLSYSTMFVTSALYSSFASLYTNWIGGAGIVKNTDTLTIMQD